MFDIIPKVSKVTWQTILVNPLIFGVMATPSDSESVVGLIATGVILAGSGLMPLSIPRIPLSASIACYIIFALGCGVSGLGLANILENQFSNFPTVSQWEWLRWMPSVSENLAILIWVYIVLHIAPVTRSLFISVVFVAAAAGYAFTSDALAIRDTLVFGVNREISDWEQGAKMLFNGCALAAWARLIIRELASTSNERFIGKITLFLGVFLILRGIFGILRDIFS